MKCNARVGLFGSDELAVSEYSDDLFNGLFSDDALDLFNGLFGDNSFAASSSVRTCASCVR